MAKSPDSRPCKSVGLSLSPQECPHFNVLRHFQILLRFLNETRTEFALLGWVAGNENRENVMRLTLRTLLAYLDDRLPPTNAKELGQKIMKSPFAMELVERIREVKRRRRLAMPEKPVAMIDANLVAEYLDDQLTPELVAKIEMEILSSDVKLAEVASAHEILGLLQDPVTIEPRLRDRLYAMDPTGKVEVARALGNEETGRAASGLQSKSTTEWRPLPVEGTSSRRLPVFIVGGLALLWLGIVVSDSVLFGPKTVNDTGANDGNQANAAVVAGDLVAVTDSNKKPDDLSGSDIDDTVIKDAVATNQPVELNALNSDAVIVTATPNNNPNSATPSGASEMSAPAAGPVATTVVASADAVPAKAVDAPGLGAQPEKDTTTKLPTPAVAEKVSYHLMSDNKTFFVFEPTADQWMRLDQIPGGEIVSTNRNNIDCEMLFKQRWFSIAEPFVANIVAENKGWNAAMYGALLARTSSEPIPGLEIFSGRMKLSVEPTDAWNEELLPAFGLRTAGVNTAITLRSKDSVAGIEVIPVATVPLNDSNGFAESTAAASLLHLNGADFRVTVNVIKGEASIELPGTEQAAMLSIGQSLTWLAVGAVDSAMAPAVAENVMVDRGNQLAAIPAWLHEDTKPVPEAEALSDQITEALAKGDDPALAMIPLVTDRNPQIAIRAVQVFSAMHDIDRLLTVLFESVDESVHRSAIDGLSRIINSSSSGRRDIRHALETRLPMTEIDMTMLLLSGISDADARDAGFCRSLVDQLNNERLATRTLAFYRIQKYSDDRLGYHPESESSRRRDAIKRWQKFLDRNNGKLIP